MRAAIITRPGDPDVFAIKDVPDPIPGPGEVRVRVAAVGVNRADLLQRRGMYPAPPGWPQDIPGLEFAGRIDALGPDVEGLDPGAPVMGIVGGGSYATLLVTRADHTIPVPAGMSLTDAAAIPEVFITAHDALVRLAVTRGEWVLVHAVGSGVGTAAVQLIRAREALSIGTSRTAAKLERAMQLGLDAGIDTGAEELVGAVRRVVPEGVHAVVDLLGGSFLPRTLETLRTKGRLILVGLTAGRNAEVDLGLVMRQRLRIEGTVLRARPAEEKTSIARSFEQTVLPLFEAGKIRPVVDSIFELDEVGAAHRYVEANENFGKVIVTLE